ncbi:MAG TPA: YtxH domain-containing protein [Phenylobacterium sp.]
MTEQPETLTPYRMPWRRDRMKQAGALTPILRYVPKNPLFLIGAAIVGVAGVMAWRNRDRIAAAAGPMIDDARAKGQALVEDARTRGEELVEQARTKGEAVVAKVRTRRRAAPEDPTTELH